MEVRDSNAKCRGPANAAPADASAGPGGVPEGGTSRPVTEHVEMSSPEETQPAPTDYRGNIWLLVAVVAVVLAAWAAERLAQVWHSKAPLNPEPGSGGTTGNLPAASGRPPLLGQDPARPLRFPPCATRLQDRW